MTLVRYRTLNNAQSLHQEMNQVIESLFRPPASHKPSVDWNPVCDVRETETDFAVRAELPGVSKDDIKISSINNTLVLKGEKKQETEETKTNWRHLERSYGSFERTFRLPTHVIAEKIKARFQDGVLEIVIPKAAEALPREIRIDS